MHIKQQKVLITALAALAVLLGFEALIYIVNLNQIRVFLWLAVALWLYIWLKVSFLYDLHFKNSGALGRARARHESIPYKFQRLIKVWTSALADRFSHFLSLKTFTAWLNYLLLPGIIFWATVAMLFVNLGRFRAQQVFVLLSTLAIAVALGYVKEIYTRKEEKVALDIFAALSSVKIYAALISFGAAITLTHYYCLSPVFLFLGVFALTFLLIYQALFQHNFTGGRNLAWTLLIALSLGLLSYMVYGAWSYNNLTAAVFLTAFYNLLWGVFHHLLEGTLKKAVFWEIVVVSLFIAVLALSVTNFRAQILPGCF